MTFASPGLVFQLNKRCPHAAIVRSIRNPGHLHPTSRVHHPEAATTMVSGHDRYVCG